MPGAYLTVLLMPSVKEYKLLPHLSGDEIEKMLTHMGADVQPISISELEQVEDNIDKYRIRIQCKTGYDALFLGATLSRHYLEGPEGEALAITCSRDRFDPKRPAGSET